MKKTERKKKTVPTSIASMAQLFEGEGVMKIINNEYQREFRNRKDMTPMCTR